MSNINYRREHQMSFERACELAQGWAQKGEEDLGLKCKVLPASDNQHQISFERSGVSGVLTVTDTFFEINAKLGFLFSAFEGKITQKLEENMDKILKA